jgi:hypothetical protein
MIFARKLFFCLAILTLLTLSHQSIAISQQVTASIKLQGGTNSSLKWKAPDTATYKGHVFVPNNGDNTDALYQIYPRGKRLNSDDCLITDIKFPCYEVIIDQTQHKNSWVQLLWDDDPNTQWDFSKNVGYVTALVDLLDRTETLNLSASIRFEKQKENSAIAIGKNYQGGIIFYIDSTGEHGLIAADSDLQTARWDKENFVGYTGASGTAVGTGENNTAKIVSKMGKGYYAAYFADNLTYYPSAYDDWFLPSKGELT